MLNLRDPKLCRTKPPNVSVWTEGSNNNRRYDLQSVMVTTAIGTSYTVTSSLDTVRLGV